MNKIHETILIDGFRVSRGDYKEFSKNVENFKHLYYDRDGRHDRPYLPYGIEIPTKNIGGNEIEISSLYKEWGLILDINAYGIVVKGTYTRRMKPKQIKYKNWKQELKAWALRRNEGWVICSGRELLINKKFNNKMIERLHYESHK